MGRPVSCKAVAGARAVSAVVSAIVPHIRRMEADDVPSVVAIEREAYSFPWTEGIFNDCLTTGYTCKVLENELGILGYAIMSVGAGECHILNICVRVDMQGCGLGENLLLHMLQLARRYKGRIAFLEVRKSNRNAFRLYHRLGFNEIGTRENYYPAPNGVREDAIVLAKLLS